MSIAPSASEEDEPLVELLLLPLLLPSPLLLDEPDVDSLELSASPSRSSLWVPSLELASPEALMEAFFGKSTSTSLRGRFLVEAGPFEAGAAAGAASSMILPGSEQRVPSEHAHENVG